MVVSTTQDFVTTSAEADRQLHRWLGELKRLDTSALDEGRNELAEGVTLDHDAAAGRRGSYSRWRLRESRQKNRGTWQSTLVVRSGNRDDDRRTWLQVDIEHHPASPDLRPIPANTPGIAKLLLDAIPAQDGLADVTTEPKFIEPDDVEEVIEELCDQDRRLPIVIASVPYGQDPEVWTQKIVEPAYKHLTGLAVVYVLRPEAQTLFNTTLDYHRVFGGGIRTYLPGVDPAWQPDAQRHLVMSRTTLEASPRRAATILAALPQRLALRFPLPAPLDTLPVQRTRPRPAAHGSGLDELRAENETLTKMLTEAEQRENANADALRDLRQQLQIAEEQEFEAAAENQDLYAKLKHAERQVRTLQIGLERTGRYDLAHAPADAPTDVPATFAEMLDRMNEFTHLRFTGDKRKARELDAQSIGNWLEVAWDALCALDDYAAASAAGTAGGDFRYWCAHLPDDCEHLFPAGKVKMKESKTVGNRDDWRRERTFPVPQAVDPGKRLFMEAHLRIGGGNMVSPRLYFYDDGPNTGLVYVGYLGPHLTNTKT
ncbi:hypothetical protein D7319_16875 [Streptomyces radicis]|uniref:Uncharacterized protein n=2 Tax=Streptomyces radicis TaxID=1750517 RepID=A0A3A9WKD3_9ACTN|nr:hypothetical protein D7319_16875 [Streptomyces radicis]RKN20541.1 hypothetical protein D7318_18735 [Streptomyces radicis]